MNLNSFRIKGTTGVDGATNPALRPGDFPLGSLESRAAARAMLAKMLEDPTKRCRLVVSAIGQHLDLEKSKCTRTWWADRTLFEMVTLHGSSEDLTEEELEDFMNRHQLKRI